MLFNVEFSVFNFQLLGFLHVRVGGCGNTYVCSEQGQPLASFLVLCGWWLALRHCLYHSLVNSESHGSSCFYLLSAGITNSRHQVLIFKLILGIEL